MAEATLVFDKDKLTHDMLFLIGRRVLERAKRMAPHDQRKLWDSLHSEVVGDEVRIFTSGCDYADKMEYGSPPVKLSSSEKEGLEGWAHRHGLKSGKGVVKYLEKNGIKVGTPTNPMHITSLGRNSFRPFLRPALHQSKGEMKTIVKEVLAGKTRF